MENTVNITFAGIGGQGVLKASDITAAVAFAAGKDVKKSEIHGMSQRGGSVSSDVRLGSKVSSPMVPRGQCDFLVVLSEDQIENNRFRLRPEGVLLSSRIIEISTLPSKKSLNVALLGVLSCHLDIDESFWRQVIQAEFHGELGDVNLKAFDIGRNLESKIMASNEQAIA